MCWLALFILNFIVVGKTSTKRQCSSLKDSAVPAKVTASADSRPKTAAKVLSLPKDGEELTSAACQPSSSSSACFSHSSTSASSSEDDENDEDVEPSKTSHPTSLLAIVKEKATMSDLVVKNVESIFRLLNK